MMNSNLSIVYNWVLPIDAPHVRAVRLKGQIIVMAYHFIHLCVEVFCELVRHLDRSDRI